ncbi:hypothetical protein TNCV_2870001 [Trichonephila clavipes]|nr:hypothetical protein TNCV_2870001 [Trichonephila clavipes]
MENSEQSQEAYTAAYLEFHKLWETRMDNLLVHLNESRTSDDSSNVIKEYEELDTKLREFPFNHVEEQSAALRSLSDVLDEKPGLNSLTNESRNWLSSPRFYKPKLMPGDSPQNQLTHLFKLSFEKKAGKLPKLRMKEVRKSNAPTSPPLKTASPNFLLKKWT